MLSRTIRLAVLAMGIAMLAAGATFAAAGGQGTVTMTQQARNVSFIDPTPTTNPCTGAPGTLSAIAKTEVFHVTFFTNGDEFWVTGTAEGTVTLTPDDPSGVSATGHFAAWFGESSNAKNDVQHDTSTFHLTGSDGSRITVHETSHFSTNANGVVTVVFDKINMTCG
jgi:hypothetical protein